MTVPELAAYMEGFAAFNCAKPTDDVPSDGEYLAALSEEIRAGRA